MPLVILSDAGWCAKTHLSHQSSWNSDNQIQVRWKCLCPWASYQIRKNCGLRMHRVCRERFPHHRLHRKLVTLVSDPGMHHGMCVTHVPWCMSGSLIRGGGENVPGIPGACATHSFAYLARGPRRHVESSVWSYWSNEMMLAERSIEQLQRFDEY